MRQQDVTDLSADNTIKHFYIENLGCAKNQVDAEIMLDALEKAGYAYVSDTDHADVIIVNTCGFILDAKTESINTFFDLRERYPEKKIIVTGCLSQRYKEELADSLPEAQAVFGNQDPARIIEVLSKANAQKPYVLIPETINDRTSRSQFINYPGSVYFKIAEGCSNNCAYCAIPVIRGKMRSRPFNILLEEFDDILARDVHEINIIAQDIASYGNDTGGPGLVGLLEGMLARKGEFQLRLLYIHPDHFPDGLLELMQRDKRLLPYFDIPVQHASVSILKKMNRSGSGQEYLTLIQRIRSSVPGAVIRTTLLVGFPGETTQDYAALKQFVKEARFDWMGVFAFSLEEDTAAYEIAGGSYNEQQQETAAKRKKELETLQEGITAERLDAWKGRKVNVLIEEPIENEDLSIGRCYAQAPEVDGLCVVDQACQAGSMVSGRILKRNGVDFQVEVLHE